MGLPAAAHATLLGRARARKPYRCCFASVFVPISDENQDGGRAFSRISRGKPTPFRGSGPHSPPRWRTRGLRCDLPLPSTRREPFRGHVWPVNCTWPWGSPPGPCCRTGLPVRFRRQDTLTDAFLRNLFTIARNAGRVNGFHPMAGFFWVYHTRLSPPHRAERRNAPGSRQFENSKLLAALHPVVYDLVALRRLKQRRIGITAHHIGQIGHCSSRPRIVVDMAHNDPEIAGKP